MFLLRRVVEHLVDKREQLHNALVQPEILLAFQQIVVLLVVAAQNNDLLRTLFRVYYCDSVVERVYIAKLTRCIVGAEQTHFGLF